MRAAYKSPVSIVGWKFYYHIGPHFKMKKLILFIALASCSGIFLLSQNAVVSYTLPNGMTVCLNEDHASQFVTGAVVCKVGDNLMPKGKETLAHCIEHMLFKGTPFLGTKNWEAEKPLYDTIVSLYKKLGRTLRESDKNELRKKISYFSNSASQYIIPGEFYLLQEDIGLGNATTYSNDYTIYHGTFLPDKLDKWLDLNAHRFTQPVFREFLKEQSVLSQEYFEKTKDESALRWGYIYKALYGKPDDDQLAENVYRLGLTDVINYYRKFYFPANMALILSGNFNSEEVKCKIEDCFSKIPAQKGGPLVKAPAPDFTKRELKNAYFDQGNSVTLVFKGAPHLSADFYPYRVALEMLSNNYSGLQDSLWHNGCIKSIYSDKDRGKNECLYYIYVRPFDHQSVKEAKGIMLHQIERLASGDFGDSLLNAAKMGLGRETDLQNEDLFHKVSCIAENFAYGMDVRDAIVNQQRFQTVTRKDIMKAAKYYLLDHYVEMYPFATKEDVSVQRSVDLAKDSILLLENYKSAYAFHFDSIPDVETKMLPVGFSDVFDTILNPGLRYYAKTNRIDKTFHLEFSYKPSKEVNNMLKKIEPGRRFEYLSPEGTETYEYRMRLGQYGCMYTFGFPGNGTVHLNIYGKDEYFQMIMPFIAELLKRPVANASEMHQLENMVPEKRNVFFTSPDSLTNVYKQLFGSLCEISYYGSLPSEQVLTTVRRQLDIREIKPKIPLNVVNQYYSNVPEIQLWLYTRPSSPKYKMHLLVLKNYVYRILWDEIRVANGLAYQLDTDIKVPDRDSTFGHLFASVITKDYQILAASGILTKVLKYLPQRENVFDCAKRQVRNDYLNRILDPKIAFDYIKDSKNRGVVTDPLKDELETLEKLTLPDLMAFYHKQFGNALVKMDIYGDIDEIGTEDYNRLKKTMELKASL
jgi:zinc protease